MAINVSSSVSIYERGWGVGGESEGGREGRRERERERERNRDKESQSVRVCMSINSPYFRHDLTEDTIIL